MGILIVFPIAAAIAILDRKKIENFFFLAIGIIISLIFASGYAGNTLPGVYAGIVLGMVALGYCLYISYVDWNRFKKYVLTQGMWGVLLCVILTYILYIGQYDLGGASDLYRVYGPQIINMYKYNNLGTGVGLINFDLLYNAPICVSWCYFCNKLWFSYSDGIIMWARDIFLIAAFAPLYSTIGKNKNKRTVILSIIILTLPYLIDPIHRYLNDILMAAVAANGIIMTLKLYRDKKRYNDTGLIAASCWSLIAICLMKRLGSFFSYGVVSIATVYTIERLFIKDNISKIKKIIPWLIFFVSIIVPTLWHIYAIRFYPEPKESILIPVSTFVLYFLMGVFSWVTLKLIKSKRYYTVLVILIIVIISSFLALYKLGVKHRDAIVIKEEIFQYTAQIFNYLSYGESLIIPDSIIILLCVVSLCSIAFLIKKNKIKSLSSVKDIEITIIPIILGILPITEIILYTYFQNNMLDSGTTGRYLRPSLMIIIVVLIYELLNIKESYSMEIALSVVIVLMIFNPLNIFTSFKTIEKTKRWDVFSKMYEDANIDITEDTHILYEGADHYGIYASFPGKADNLVLAKITSIEELSEYIIDNDYDYFVIDEYDHSFLQNYQDMFLGGKDDIREHMVYNIVINDKEVKFELIEHNN